MQKITRSVLIEKVEKFVKASIKGWEEAINNPQESINDLIKTEPSDIC